MKARFFSQTSLLASWHLDQKSEKGVFWKRGLFRKIYFLEILEREPPGCGKQRRIRRFSRDSRDFRDSRDSSSEKTPFVVTPSSGPESGWEIASDLPFRFWFMQGSLLNTGDKYLGGGVYIGNCNAIGNADCPIMIAKLWCTQGVGFVPSLFIVFSDVLN